MSEKKDFFSHLNHSHPTNGTNGHHYFNEEEDEDDHDIYEDEAAEEEFLTDEIDHEILMHRDAHFAGDFKLMLDYYLSDHIGINPDFEIERIEYLAQIEHEMGRDLAPLLLSGPEAERVARARQMYRQFKGLYDIDDPQVSYPRLIADLVLSEEAEPELEIEAIVKEGEKIVPSLIQIIQSDDAYDPLYPGYGFAPYLAIQCLGKIQDPGALIPIFEVLGRETVFGEEVVLEALSEIGQPAKEFLLKILVSRPLTNDNVNAAFALTAFPLDKEVAVASFKQLQDSEVQEKPLLSSYLLCNCEALAHTPFQDSFIQLASNPQSKFPRDVKVEMKKMIEEWK